MPEPIKTWEEWAREMLNKMSDNNQEMQKLREDFSKKLDEMDDVVNKLNTRLSVQEVKSGIWGALSGAVTAIASVLLLGRK